MRKNSDNSFTAIDILAAKVITMYCCCLRCVITSLTVIINYRYVFYVYNNNNKCISIVGVVVMAVNVWRFGAKSLTLSKLLPYIIKMLEDQNSSVSCFDWLLDCPAFVIVAVIQSMFM